MIPILPEQFLICRKDEEFITEPSSAGLPPSVVAIAHPFASHRHPACAVPSGRARLGGNVRARMAQHHHRVARGAHKVVTLLVHPAILAMVKPVFIEPIGKVLENLEAPALHPNQHVLNASLDTHAAVLELRMLVQHVQTLRSILISQRLAGAFQGQASTHQSMGGNGLIVSFGEVMPMRRNRLQRQSRRAFWASAAPEVSTSELASWCWARQTLVEKRAPSRWQRESMIRAARSIGAVRTRRIGREWLWRLRTP